MENSDSYTVAVIADIHGNAAALKAVLDDLKRRRHDSLVIAGDLVLNGPRPIECLNRIRDVGVSTLCGNADQYVFDEAYSYDGLNWVREKLGTDGLNYLKTSPSSKG